MRKRALHLSCIGGLIASVAVLRLYPDLVLAMGYSCVLGDLTGWKCPFCGMTRDFVAMAKGLPPHLNPFSAAVASALYLAYPLTVALSWARGEDVPGISDPVRQLMVPILIAMFIGNNL